MTATVPCLSSLPPELLEHVAFFAFDPHSLAPFGDLHSLAACSRPFSRQLQPSHNPLLHARLFRSTFDCAALRRRIALDNVPPAIVAVELQRRFQSMWRFRREPNVDDLWTALLMLFENDGRNRRLLDLHADVRRAAKARLNVATEGHVLRRPRIDDAAEEWPVQTKELNLLLWILWLTATEEDRDDTKRSDLLLLTVLTPYTLGGHRYALSRLSWTQLHPRALPSGLATSYFGAPLTLRDPEFVPVAILHYLLRLLTAPAIHAPLPTATSAAWDADFERTRLRTTDVLRPGTFAGVWEGAFLFMEFHNYIGLLHGAGPRTLLSSYVGQHAQIWKLRAYALPRSGGAPPPAGDALDGHLPRGAVLRESRDALELALGERTWTYHAADEDDEDGDGAADVIVAGEGHSTWGRFTLRGRVRPVDGLVTLVKQYTNRGLWLYRGFVVGGRDGHLVGRWRDVESPVEQEGYEGCFVLGRRRE